MKRAKIIDIRKNYYYDRAEPEKKWGPIILKVVATIASIVIFFALAFKMISWYN